MNAPLAILAGLLRLVGTLLRGTSDYASRIDGTDKLGYPDIAKLRSTHVDPYRTGNYFAWTKRDE